MSCVAICPEVFEMTSDGNVDVKSEYKGKDITDKSIMVKIKEASIGCPSTAIVIVE
jgi:ferredoxin